MLAGHYAASFAAKAAGPKVPLWILFIAAQLVDIFWAVFVLTGVERATLDTSLPSNPLVAEYMPYTHSLLGAVVAAAVAWIVVQRFHGARSALLVALVVVSHWFLDLLMHRNDLTLAGSPPMLGFALWDYATIAHTFELALLVLTVVVFRPTRTSLILLAVLVVVQLYSIFAPPPETLTQMTISLEVLWVGLPALAWWLESREAHATTLRPAQ